MTNPPTIHQSVCSDGGYALRSTVWVPARRDDVFAFFADAFNLETMTPPWLRFRVLTPGPIPMHEGQSIDYRLRVHGIPLRWTSEIEVWDPPHRFVDRQVKGPYRFWRHEHRFTDEAGGTRIADTVHYDVPGGAWIHRLFVGPDVRRIFAFRRERLRELFVSSTDCCCTDVVRQP